MDVLHHTAAQEVEEIHLVVDDKNLLKTSKLFHYKTLTQIEDIWALSFRDRRRFADMILANHQNENLTNIQIQINEYETARKEFMDAASTRYCIIPSLIDLFIELAYVHPSLM